MSVIGFNTIIVRLFAELDMVLNHFVYNSYASLATHLKTPLAAAAMIYIILLGYSITAGWVQASMSNFIKSAVKLGLVLMFALQWDVFSHWVVEGIEGGASQIAGWLMNGVNHDLFTVGNDSVNLALQKTFSEFTRIGALLWHKGSWHALGPYLNALFVWGAGLVFVGLAVFELALAKIMLAILFGTAPLFVGFTLFKPTHGFFDRWLGAIVGYALMFIFVSVMLALALYLAEWSLAGILVGNVLHFNIVGWLPIALVCALGVGIILSAAKLAQSIGGTVTTAAGASLVAGAVGGAVSGAMMATPSRKSTMMALKGTGKATAAILGLGSGKTQARVTNWVSGLKRNYRGGE